MNLLRGRLSAVVVLIAASLTGKSAETAERGLSFRESVQADWAAREKLRDRTIGDPSAIRDTARRCDLLIEDLSSGPNPPGLTRDRAEFAKLIERVRQSESLDATEQRSLDLQLRWFTRRVAMKNPLIATRKILFLKRRRFVVQMLHEYLGYYYDYADIEGGGVFILDKPGSSFATRALTNGKFPRGNFTTLALSYDASTAYFAFAPRSDKKTDFYSPDRSCFHIYRMNLNDGRMCQLSDGPYDDFDPCPLPDGGIAFMSTRRGGFGRCHNPWEPLPAYTLHRMDADGSRLRTLSFHETNEWHPSVLADGRVVYTRWDYVDRSAANFHGLWTSNPDGTNPMVLFGNYTRHINACYQPRAVPGSNKIAFIAGAHHAAVGGALVMLDPTRVGLDDQTGEDRFEAIDQLTPDVCFPEAPGWPDHYFHSPWPLSEDYFLIAASFDPLPGSGPNEKRDTKTGLYLLDRFGNLELLYREAGISSMYPIPLVRRRVPPVVIGDREPALKDEAEVILSDVQRSHFALPADRPIRALRIFQILPKSETHIANQPQLGYANAESARFLLGTVPVEPDGSARFRVPSRRPIYFQAVDQQGHAVQSMRSVMYFQPGERRSCVGCHEPPGSTPNTRDTLAMRRPASQIQPGPDGSRPWSYARLIQPILNKHCVACHDGSSRPGTHEPDLTGAVDGQFTVSYRSLKPFVRWYEWDGGIGGDVTRPGQMPSAVSPLMDILKNEQHASELDLSDDEYRRICLWLDGNSAFFGTYAPGAQTAQRNGERVPLPDLQ